MSDEEMSPDDLTRFALRAVIVSKCVDLILANVGPSQPLRSRDGMIIVKRILSALVIRFAVPGREDELIDMIAIAAKEDMRELKEQFGAAFTNRNEGKGG